MALEAQITQSHPNTAGKMYSPHCPPFFHYFPNPLQPWVHFLFYWILLIKINHHHF